MARRGEGCCMCGRVELGCLGGERGAGLPVWPGRQWGAGLPAEYVWGGGEGM